MKLLFEFLPIIAFFIAYKAYDIYYATVVIIVIMALQLGYSWFRKHEIKKVQLISLVIVAVLGGLTLSLRNPIFIKWKPTIIYWLLAITFAVSHFIGKKTIIQHLLGQKVDVPENVWRRINLYWIAFFIAVGALNIYVLYNFSTDTWVNFKLFGLLGLTVVFIIAQSLYLARYITNKDE